MLRLPNDPHLRDALNHLKRKQIRLDRLLAGGLQLAFQIRATPEGSNEVPPPAMS